MLPSKGNVHTGLPARPFDWKRRLPSRRSLDGLGALESPQLADNTRAWIKGICSARSLL